MRRLPLFGEVDPENLTRRQRLVLTFGGGLLATVLTYSVLYYWGMRTLEGGSPTIFQALNTVVETMSTTGYGADAPWTTPEMNLFMVAMQFSGVVIGFVALRILVIPLFERTPVNLDDSLTPKSDHVVVAEYRRDTELLLDELEALDVDYVLLETDFEAAQELSDAGYQAIDGDPESRADLERASVGSASLLITDAGDTTASVVLTARELNPDLRVISFTPSTRRHAALAEVGVTRSVAPNALIGRRLAEKASTPFVVAPTEESDQVEIREIVVSHEAGAGGRTVGESALASHPDLTLVAGWFDGELRLVPAPHERITPNTVLVVAGPARALDQVTAEMTARRPRQVGDRSRVVVAGLDEGGAAAVAALPESVSVTTVDESPDAGADVVGDVTEPETLREVEIDDAAALIVTLDDDASALLAAAMARSLAPETEILVRVTDAEKTSPAFGAGADYVLSVQRVCARLVAGEIYGERVMAPVGQLRLVRADADPLVGQSLEAVRAERERGWTVVGVSRDGTVLTAPETTIESGDEVFVAGSDESLRDFERRGD